MAKLPDPDRLAVVANQNSTERAYWLEQLARPVKQSFPYDFACVGEPDRERRMDEIEICISPDFVPRLMELSNGTDVKLNMILTAAVVVLLYKYTGERDIITGAPIYRQRVDSEYINTVLPLRHRLFSRMTFKMLLRQVRQTIADAVRHQNFPVLLLPGPGLLDLPVQGDPCPLFDVAVLLGNLHDPRYIAHMKHNVTFGFYRDGVNGVMGGILLYNPLLFRRESMDTLVRRFVWLLEALIFNVEMELGGVDMLTEQERKKIEEEFNGRTVDYPLDKTLHRLFEEQAARTPDRIAAVGLADGFLTYRELNEKSNKLARLLRANGVMTEMPVGIMTEPSLEMMTGLLGILKAGGAYLPLDPGFPAERIAYMLKDSGAEVVLSVWDLKGRLPAAAGVICLDDMHIYRGNGANLKHPDSPLDLAYILYTSGTTGRPKGVLTEHGNVVAYVFAFYCEFSISEQDTGLQLASYTSDIFTEEIYPLLLKGGKTVIPSAGEAVDVPRLIEWMVKLRVTLVDTTPVLLREFNRWADRIVHGAELPVLTFISGGETLKPGDVDKLVSPAAGYRVYNTYGPTETTVCATYYRCIPGIPWRSFPIGKPAANYRVDILNEAGLPQPVGIAGEIWIAGPGAARGYLNEVERSNRSYRTYRTYKTYRSDRTDRYDRSYRSGDFGRWLPDGNIEFLGRGDGQVKIRGFRIELGEIENRLTAHEGVREAVVTARQDEHGDPYLCAYVVCEEGFEFSSPVSEVLKEYLALRLPYYMIPLCVVPIPAIPVTANGKIDTRALPEPEIESQAPYEAPANSLETDIRRVWCQLFGKEKIGVHDDFFDLGGHSLKGIQLLNALHRELGVKIPLADLFRVRTIRGLARFITGFKTMGGAGETFPSPEPVEKKEFYPLSSVQKQLYFMQQLNPGSPAYNVSGVLVLDIDTTMEAVRQRVEETFKKLIRRHESLRTSFHIIGGEPVQRIWDDAAFAIDASDTAKNIKAFDLAHAPLLRVGLMKTGKGTDLMMVDLHHIITDAISQQILVRDFSSLYDGKELPPLELQYKDYCIWLATCREQGEGGNAFKRREEYWLREFSGELPRLDLPSDFPRPPRSTLEGAVLRFEMDTEETRALKRLAVENGATLFMVLLAVYYILLSKLGGAEDVVIGTPASGRCHPDLEQVMGVFVNTLALRNFPAEDKTCTDFLKEVKKKTLGAFENRDYPFEELVERLGAGETVNRGPLFDCMFSLHEFDETNRDEDRRAAADDDSFHFEQPTSKFDITLTAAAKGERLFFLFRYSTALFKKEKIERFAGYFRKIVSEVVAGPGKKIGDISLISQEEKDALSSRLSMSLRV